MAEKITKDMTQLQKEAWLNSKNRQCYDVGTWDFLGALRSTEQDITPRSFENLTDEECLDLLKGEILRGIVNGDEKYSLKILNVVVCAKPEAHDADQEFALFLMVFTQIQDTSAYHQYKGTFPILRQRILGYLLRYWLSTACSKFWDEDRLFVINVFNDILGAIKESHGVEKQAIEESIDRLLVGQYRRWSEKGHGQKTIQRLGYFLQLAYNKYHDYTDSQGKFVAPEANPYHNVVRLMAKNLLRHMDTESITNIVLTRFEQLKARPVEYP